MKSHPCLDLDTSGIPHYKYKNIIVLAQPVKSYMISSVSFASQFRPLTLFHLTQ